MIYTSLEEIQSFRPCPFGWKDILVGQKKTKADEELFPLTEAVESNSISDVCWLLRKRKKEIQVCVRFARLCANSVAHLKNRYAAATATATAAIAAAAATAAYATAEAAYTDAVAAYTDAKQKQEELNKQFLIQCITEWSED